MTIPTDEELKKFREGLQEKGVDEVATKLRHHTYGAKDNWHYKEAEVFIRKHNEDVEAGIKLESIEQAKQNNRLQSQANKIARWALTMSVLALIISLLVAVFK